MSLQQYGYTLTYQKTWKHGKVDAQRHAQRHAQRQSMSGTPPPLRHHGGSSAYTTPCSSLAADGAFRGVMVGAFRETSLPGWMIPDDSGWIPDG